MSLKNIKLPVEISIANVEHWHEKLLLLLDSGDSISLDASDLQRVDTAALQLFTALIRESKSRAVTVSWINASDELLQAAEILGLKDSLSLMNKPI